MRTLTQTAMLQFPSNYAYYIAICQVRRHQSPLVYLVDFQLRWQKEHSRPRADFECGIVEWLPQSLKSGVREAG